ncbi:MAG: nucleic acid-binding protein [Pseudanabaena sp.]|nr:MAG: nucleic acid-binding protein [Pseudanabaena sp.]
MSLWILDTNHIRYLQNSHPNILKRLVVANPKDVAITDITAEEQIRGWLKFMDVKSERCVWAYKGFRDTLAYLGTINILNFDENAYQIYLDLKKQLTNRVGTKDLQIAAIALSVGGIVVTSNYKDFGQVPNLPIEDWTL